MRARWTGLVLALMAIAALVVPAHPARADVHPLAADHVDASPAGYMGCVTTRARATRYAGCVVAYRVTGGVRVVVLGYNPPSTVGVAGVSTTWFEDEIVPDSALTVGGDLGYPTVSLSVLVHGNVQLSLTADALFTPGYDDESQHCVGTVNPLQYALASDGAVRRVTEAHVSGTWGSSAVVDYGDPCTWSYGTLFDGPVDGAWALYSAYDEGLVGSVPAPPA